MPDDRTPPPDLIIEIDHLWSSDNGKHPGTKTYRPADGWTNPLVSDAEQAVIHVRSKSQGLDHWVTLMGPFPDKAIKWIIDTIERDFWHSSPR